MKKAILKRTGDALEKIAIGSVLVGMFQGQIAGFVVSVVCMSASYALTAWEARL